MASDELSDISRGDPALAKFMRESLRRLENGTNPALAEMARDVLAGRVELRQALASESYASALGEGMAKFADWHRSQDPEKLEANRLHFEGALEQARRNQADSEQRSH